MKPLALVVEDDASIREALADRLDSLGHDHQCVGSQNEARERISRCSFSYILLDLELPVRYGRLPSISVGKNLLREIRQTPKHASTPIIVVTAHGHDRPDLAVEVMKAGATDFVKKPFDNLDQAIREALAIPVNGSGVAHASATHESHEPRSLDGATLVYYRDRIELAGVTVCTPENGVIWRILLMLRDRRADGRPRAFPGKAIANSLGLDRGQNAVCDAVSPFRRKISQLLESEGFAATDDALIITGKSGYQTRPDLIVDDRTGLDPTPDDEPGTISADERQAWFIAQLQQGVKLRRRDHEKHFGISVATAKRDLGALADRVEFIGAGSGGHYVLSRRL